MNQAQKLLLAAIGGLGLYLLYDRYKTASQSPPPAKPRGLLDSLSGISRTVLGLVSTEEVEVYRPFGYAFMPSGGEAGYTPPMSLPAGMYPAMFPGLHEGSYVPEYVRSALVGAVG